MLYLTHTPSPPLDAFVARFWLYQNYLPVHHLERILPAGSVDWIINLTDGRLRVYDADDPSRWDEFEGPLISGVQTRHCIIDTAQQAEVMGIQLRPGATEALLGLPADALRNQQVPLTALWGDDAANLQERLLAAPISEQRFAILEQALQARLIHDGTARHPAVVFAVGALHHGMLTGGVADLVREAGMSDRHFISLFRRQVGVTPKRYGRIQRFQRVLAHIANADRLDWPAVALDFGYYDQAHLNREFREFSGLRPTAYRAVCGEHYNHVPLEERGQICPIPDAPSPR